MHSVRGNVVSYATLYVLYSTVLKTDIMIYQMSSCKGEMYLFNLSQASTTCHNVLHKRVL